MEKKAIFPGDPKEWKATYSPAFQVSGGRLLLISGQVAFDDQGQVVGQGVRQVVGHGGSVPFRARGHVLA